MHHDFTKFNLLKPRLLEIVDKMLAEDIARLMAQIPHEETTTVPEPLIKGKNLYFVLFVYLCCVCLPFICLNFYNFYTKPSKTAPIQIFNWNIIKYP